MDTATFEAFRSLIYRESGITLGPDKAPLLTNRIRKRLQTLGMSSPQQYIESISKDKSGMELAQLLEAISTNTTHFFREAEHFDRLAEQLVELEKAKKRRIRIWCAAASSGEEPYTLAITAREAVKVDNLDLKILCTDLNTKVLQHALRGNYLERQLRDVPANIKSKYFSKHSTQSGIHYSVDPVLAKSLVFKKLNLVHFPYPLNGPLDVIFCRNVMIYFDNAIRQKIIDQFERLLAPGGYLYLSHSENVLGLNTNLKPLGRSLFRKDK